jgi:hypothetical protein
MWWHWGKNVGRGHPVAYNPLTPELNPCAQRCLPRFIPGILIFEVHTALSVYKSFGVKGLKYNIKMK